ncbi:iron complex outermembrane recepter protein [Cyclobacterium lianum]|uniref:Iron complex outermembrane recepter protein n=1 Tax=Cyclobacterium lianum TaxID=388280 RepID=A0A1M7LBB0_9BACT|nr:TonB-dependent receptor [Cyclobacterium lianum]SHM75356.1 iron complex outermembrane recepter protein [Cyclobacterium lianum]
MKYSILLLPLGWFFLLQSPLAAQQSDTLGLDQVVVTGTRMAQDASQISSSISVVDKGQLNASGHINVLPALVRHVPGLMVNDRSLLGFGVGPGSGGNISIRGISGSPNNRVLVLIDGQPQFMGIFAHPIADAYQKSDFERVEVIRGAAAVLYGSNAMGGAINLITDKGGKEGWSGQIGAASGSFGTHSFTGKVNFEKGKWQSLVSLNRSKTEGFRKDARDSFENSALFYKLSFQAEENINLMADFQLSDAVYYHPGTLASPLTEDRRAYLRGRVSLGVKNQGDRISGAALFFHNFGNHDFKSGFESTDFSQGFTLYQNLQLIPGQTLTLGIDHNRFGGEAVNPSLPPAAAKGLDITHRINQTDIYLQVEQSIWERLHVNVGLREINNAQFGKSTVPGFGFSYEFNPKYLLKMSSAKAFRSPSVVDLFLFPPSNDALNPETLWNHELTITRSIPDRDLEMDLVFFYTKGDNLIQIDPSESPPVNRNTGAFRNRGLESQVRYSPGETVDLVFNYSFLDVTDNVLFAPRHHLNMQVRRQIGKFSVTPFLQQVFGLNNSPQAEDETIDYTLLNIDLNYQVIENVSCYVLANNLFDTSYQLENGYPMPGINITAGINVEF